MGDHDMLRRLERGESIPLAEFTRGHDAITALIIESGGLLPFCARLDKKQISVPAPGTAKRAMNITEKILAAKLLPGQGQYVKPNDAVLVRVDAGYSHEFTTAQVDKFLTDEYGNYKLQNPTKFAVFEDHLIYATGVPSMAKFADKIEKLRVLQRAFAEKTGVRNFSAKNGVSRGGTRFASFFDDNERGRGADDVGVVVAHPSKTHAESNTIAARVMRVNTGREWRQNSESHR